MPISSTDYWDLPVSASNQRLSVVSDERKTSVTETTETKPHEQKRKFKQWEKTYKGIGCEFPEKTRRMMDATESNLTPCLRISRDLRNAFLLVRRFSATIPVGRL